MNKKTIICIILYALFALYSVLLCAYVPRCLSALYYLLPTCLLPCINVLLCNSNKFTPISVCTVSNESVVQKNVTTGWMYRAKISLYETINSMYSCSG